MFNTFRLISGIKRDGPSYLFDSFHHYHNILWWLAGWLVGLSAYQTILINLMYKLFGGGVQIII